MLLLVYPSRLSLAERVNIGQCRSMYLSDMEGGKCYIRTYLERLNKHDIDDNVNDVEKMPSSLHSKSHQLAAG